MNSTTYSLEADNRLEEIAQNLRIPLEQVLTDLLELEKLFLVCPVPSTQCYSPTRQGMKAVRNMDIKHKRLDQDWS